MSVKRTRPPGWERWRNMVRRCTDPSHPAWHNYGGRGIAVCDEWLGSFDAYYAHIGDPPQPGLTVDRIDNDGDYEPANVRWATRQEQNRNARNAPALRTHCPQNHPYDDANTLRDRQGRRHCRACRNQRQRDARRAA